MQVSNSNDNFQKFASPLVFLNLYDLKAVYAYNTGKAIGDCENTLSFPSEETSLGSGLPSHLPREMHHARRALLTVFSTTQLGHSITQLVIRSRIWKCIQIAYNEYLYYSEDIFFNDCIEGNNIYVEENIHHFIRCCFGHECRISVCDRSDPL